MGRKHTLYFLFAIIIIGTIIFFFNKKSITQNEWCSAVTETKDNCYIICSSQINDNPISMRITDSNVYLLKINGQGEKIWEKTIHTEQQDTARAILNLSDGGCIICGYSFLQKQGMSTLYVFRIDTSGNILWEKRFDRDYSSWAYNICKSHDNNMIIVGTINKNDQQQHDILLVKIDIHGNILWEKTIGGKGEDRGRACIETNNHDLLIIGQTNSFSDKENYDIYLSRLTSGGDILWEQTFGEMKIEFGFSVIELGDDEFIACGTTEKSDEMQFDIYINKCDSKGNIVWETTMGSTNRDIGYSLTKIDYDQFVMTGTWDAPKRYDEKTGSIVVATLNDKGDTIWRKELKGKYRTFGYTSVATKDNHIIVTGLENILEDSPALVVYKLNKAGEVIWEKKFKIKE